MAHHYLLKASDKPKIFKAGREKDVIDTPSELRIFVLQKYKNRRKRMHFYFIFKYICMDIRE